MESDWAAENLRVIRTLMERSAIYRRALAPMMLLAGSVGMSAAVLGWFARIESARAFVGYWLVVAVLTMAGSFLLLRRQALRDGEPLWSPPTRRVTQALLPALVSGLVGSSLTFVSLGSALRDPFGPVVRDNAEVVGMFWLPLAWIVLYGCAIHAAGFFMPRGIRLFGWVFILGGCALFAVGVPDLPRPIYAHGVMGLFFGGLHLGYGVYLFCTEKRKNEA